MTSVSKSVNVHNFGGRQTHLLKWRPGEVVITTSQLHWTKPERRFCTGPTLACSVLEIHDG